MERFGVSMERELLEQFDALLAREGYVSRSEAIRDLVRARLVEQEWERPTASVVATITVVYEHSAHELGRVLTEMQHRYHGVIICSTHVHLDEENCLEVVVLKGRSGRVREIADRLISTRGVKHGKVVLTTTGTSLP